ncbi:hypothetical protein BDD43_4425 [Mucilaginibacter gracilis]|uniref:Uncharacterized protein n=1 Tax=Mucilaginibacter gracilis TaxID=423350 RepID=A0A495J709_9SPHI|nr:hypothetical protein [Mucilaginibacter gracilis]RKR84198.1 hypothetical protein BDD43_4425 [Mucilaginibacter gracilis]
MDFRQRLEQSRVQLAGNIPATEPDEDWTCAYYGIERGNSPVCLDLRLPDGSRKAFPYSYFTAMHFDVDTGIEIQTNQKRIVITGRNLTKLFEQLITYRVRYVQADVGNDTQDDGLFVAAILIDGF